LLQLQLMKGYHLFSFYLTQMINWSTWNLLLPCHHALSKVWQQPFYLLHSCLGCK
jgi:hypothetical protein